MKLGPMLSRLQSYVSAVPAAPGIREAARNQYTPRSAHFAHPGLDRAFDKHIDDIKPGATVGYHMNKAIPQGTVRERVEQVINNPTAYAGSTAPGESPAISINPTSGREMLAHELGHLASQQTDVGHLVATLRHNPQLKNALLGSLMVLPGAAAVLEEGNDDMDSSLALAALTAAPKLIDEGLATKHGLAIMDKAGMRATLGQRGKLAGGLLSYLAPAVITGIGANAVGNMLD